MQAFAQTRGSLAGCVLSRCHAHQSFELAMQVRRAQADDCGQLVQGWRLLCLVDRDARCAYGLNAPLLDARLTRTATQAFAVACALGFLRRREEHGVLPFRLA